MLRSSPPIERLEHGVWITRPFWYLCRGDRFRFIEGEGNTLRCLDDAHIDEELNTYRVHVAQSYS